MTHTRTLVALAALALAAPACGKKDAAPDNDAGDAGDPHAPRPVALTTSDGVVLQGTLEVGDPNRPAAILLHGLGGDRQDWSPLFARVHHDHPGDLSLLAIDLRGHGESTHRSDGTPLDWRDFGNDPKHWQALAEDVRTAVGYLRNTYGPTSLVLVGADVGGLAAVSALDPMVEAGVVLISPAPSLRGLALARPLLAFLQPPAAAPVDTSPAALQPTAATRAELIVTRGDVDGLAATESLLAAVDRPGGHNVGAKIYDDDAERGLAIAVHQGAFWDDVYTAITHVLEAQHGGNGYAPP